MRRPVLLALALACASCAYPPGYAPPPATLLLRNPGPDHVAVETVVTVNADCNAPSLGRSSFSLPPDGTRFIAAPPGAAVCWRIAPAASAPAVANAAPPEWNRTYLSPGKLIETRI